MTKSERIEIFKKVMGEKYDYTIVRLDEMGFFTAPASTHYHGAYEGGLFDHSHAVANVLAGMTRRMDLKWIRGEESPLVVGMFHDICKCDNYVTNPDGTFSYNKNCVLTGHGDKSAILVQSLLGRVPEQELLCIRYHMGAYEGEKVWQNLGAAIEKERNVLWTHTADMYVSKVMGL